VGHPGRMRLACVSVVVGVVLGSGCGLLLDAGPSRDDAGIDALSFRDGSPLDVASDDGPGLDAALPDAPAPDGGAPDAERRDAFEPDARPTCACPELPLDGCGVPRCVGDECVVEDDDGRCAPDRGEVCVAGECVEGCEAPACRPPADVCATAVCVGRACVRSPGVPCPAGTACFDGVCRPAGDCVDPSTGRFISGEVCRTAPPGSCVGATLCDGRSADCPIDGPPAPSGTPCGTATPGLCRPRSLCNGLERTCPSPGFLDWDSEPDGMPDCRALGGACSAGGDCIIPGGSCTGRACLVDCRVGVLDCSSSPPTCRLASSPPVAPRGAVCAEAVPPCLEARRCNGVDGSCPPAAFLGGVCQPSRGPCDAPEHCELGNVCPPDARVAAGTPCRPSRGSCDVAEVCDGSNDFCPPDAVATDDTACGSNLGCEHCHGGACELAAFASACTHPMGGGGQCDATGACVRFSGASCAVPGSPCAVGELDAFGDCVVVGAASSDTVCSPAGPCVRESRCTGGPSVACPTAEPTGGTCTVSCPAGRVTAACVDAFCPAVCPAAVD